MPTYEYRCANGHTFERFQRMTEEPIDKCPECDADTERLMSAGAGLLFKGSGFYITDYRSDSYKKAAAADTGDKSETKKSDSGSDKAASAKSDKPASGGSSSSAE